MTTIKNTFEETVKTTVNNFCNTISHQLSTWLKENKDSECSPEEICKALDVPYRPPSGLPSGATIQTQMPNLPSYYAGTGVSPKKKGGRTKKPVDPNLPICEYTLKRGKNPGQRCSNQVSGTASPGADRFCKQCLKKTAVKSLLEEESEKTTVQPPLLPGNTVEVTNQEETKSEELSVVPIDGREGVFREVNHGFIVRQEDDGSIVAFEIDDSGTFRKLNETEKKIAEGLGLQVISEKVEEKVEEEKVEEVTPTVPEVPQVVVPTTLNIPRS